MCLHFGKNSCWERYSLGNSVAFSVNMLTFLPETNAKGRKDPLPMHQQPLPSSSPPFLTSSISFSQHFELFKLRHFHFFHGYMEIKVNVVLDFNNHIQQFLFCIIFLSY